MDNVEHDKEKLQKTFAELRIDDIKGSGNGWITNIVRDPFGHTMGFLAKMSDAYTVIPGKLYYFRNGLNFFLFFSLYFI